MALVEKTVLVPYSAEQMFALVDDVVAYPKFLPWCGGSSVDPVEDDTVHATVQINYMHIKHSFTTRNVRQRPARIDMTLENGPFRHLDGSWQFIALNADACKIAFRLHYEFSGSALDQVLSPVFQYIANSFVDAFVQRAEEIYDRND